MALASLSTSTAIGCTPLLVKGDQTAVWIEELSGQSKKIAVYLKLIYCQVVLVNK